MKLLLPNQIGPRRTADCAFTLAEMLIAFGIFMLVVAAMVAVQLFGLRMYTLAATKLSATEGCRKTMNSIRDQIREANYVDVGICTSTPSFFNSLSTNVSQQGNAVKVYPTIYTNAFNATYNTNIYSLFYLNMTDTNNCKMTRFTVASNAANTGLVTNTAVLAGYITNLDIFTAEDYQGTPLTNEQSWDKREVISIKLQFYQWEYPTAKVGTNGGGSMYDSYQLRTRVTQRAL
jgi:type II secretory pathway pseudopilin PulG